MTENYVDGVYNPTITDEDAITEYRYDKVGSRTRIIDARSNETVYFYDDLNRRIETHDPLNNVTAYGYDAVGNRTVITDANGMVTTFDYDRVNRLETIDYADTTPDVSFTYDKLGNRIEMIDGTGVTTYTYDALYRLKGVNDGAELEVGYDYDAVGNRTLLYYPDGKEVTYTYDDGNRLDTVTDWHNGQFGYNYDDANRLLDLTLPNDVTGNYTYDDAGRLTLLTHSNITETLASYDYALDNVGNRIVLTETLVAVQDVPAGVYLESDGLVVMEAENGQSISGTTHTWLTVTTQSGYTGTAYLQALPDVDALYQTNEITDSSRVEFAVNFTTPGTYTVWLRGYVSSAAGDSAYVKLDDDVVNVTGFAPNTWEWAGEPTGQVSATVMVASSGLKTISLLMREDGLRVDRLLLTTDTNFIPSDFGPTESQRQGEATDLIVTLDRTISYEYDDLYRLTNAGYTSGEAYEYSYDPVGNRLQQIIDGDTTEYLYDAANRLEAVNGQSYTFDNNGNLLSTDVMTNVFDTANRLIETSRDDTTLQPIYNGLDDRVGQTVGVTTTYLALDVMGLPEVIYTSEGNAYLHLPGVIVVESAGGEVRYLLSDGLGSVRQVVDENAQVVGYNEYDPYGTPVVNASFSISNYGFTGEWWEDEVGLLHLRARWYQPQHGIFLSRDPVESEPPYAYVRGNPVNWVDPSGYQGACGGPSCGPDITGWLLVEIGRHYEYGKQVKALYDNMIDQTLNPGNWRFNSNYVPRLPTWHEIELGPPFDEIVTSGIPDRVIDYLNERNQNSIGYPQQLSKGGLVPLRILRLIEYGLYGLAVDYSQLSFTPLAVGKPCTNHMCKLGRSLSEQHDSVTVCGKCIDQSDLGNLIFGVGGAGRGLSQAETFVWAQAFNLSADSGPWSTAFNEDPRAALPGWSIAKYGYYFHKATFCETLERYDRIFGIHEDPDTAKSCLVCDNYYVPQFARHGTPSSLTRVSGIKEPTVDWFKRIFSYMNF